MDSRSHLVRGSEGGPRHIKWVLSWCGAGALFAGLAYGIYFSRFHGDFDRMDNVIIRRNISLYPWYHWFFNDWGVGDAGFYRPLQVLIFYMLRWLHLESPVGYTVFQQFNLGAMALLLVAFLRSLGVTFFASTCLALLAISSPSVWGSLWFVSDSSSFFQVSCLIGMYFLSLGDIGRKGVGCQWGIFFALCLVALGLKESGLVVVGAVICLRSIQWFLGEKRTADPAILGLMIGLVICYLIVRHYALASGTIWDPLGQNGFYFSEEFKKLSETPKQFQIKVAIYNIMVHFATHFAPIAGGMGELPGQPVYWYRAIPFTVLSAAIFCSFGKLRKNALFYSAASIVVMTSLISFPYFRYRMHFISDVAVVIMLALAMNGIRSRTVKGVVYAAMIAVIVLNVLLIEAIEPR